MVNPSFPLPFSPAQAEAWARVVRAYRATVAEALAVVRARSRADGHRIPLRVVRSVVAGHDRIVTLAAARAEEACAGIGLTPEAVRAMPPASLPPPCVSDRRPPHWPVPVAPGARSIAAAAAAAWASDLSAAGDAAGAGRARRWAVWVQRAPLGRVPLAAWPAVPDVLPAGGAL